MSQERSYNHRFVGPDDMLDLRTLLFLSIAAAAGCASHSSSSAPMTQPAAPAAVASPTTSPANPNSELTLDQIEPRLQLSATTQTGDDSSSPIEAVRLFAQARIAELNGNRPVAGDLLEQAIKLDSQSFSLHEELANLYAAASDSRAAEEWEKAAAIEPDHLDLQINLGRSAVNNGDYATGIEHLRLGLLTTAYRLRDPAAAEDDFLLARALEHEGFDTAALQLYERLMARLRNPGFSDRLNPQVAALLTHPDALPVHVAELYEHRNEYARAVQLLRDVAARHPEDFDFRILIIHDLSKAGEREAAIHEAAELVAQRNAAPRSVALLREVAGEDTAAVLDRLRRQQPADRDLTIALIDVLRADNRLKDARQMLADATARWPDDLRLVRRRAAMLRSDGNLKAAAGIVISALANRPEHDAELSVIWEMLSFPSPAGALRSSEIRDLKVSRSDEPARLLLLSRLAASEHRDAPSLEWLQKAVASRPVFLPAWREMLARIWTDPSRNDATKIHDCDDLTTQAQSAGNSALAAELRGQSLLNQGKADAASLEFANAVKAGSRSPELYADFALALHSLNNDDAAEPLLWRLLSDHPFFPTGYSELYAIFDLRKDRQKANRILSLWLAADPDGIEAPRLAAREAFEQRRYTDAQRILLDLLDRHDSDPMVLGSVVQLYGEIGRLPELTGNLEQRLKAQPWNSSLAIALADVYQQQHQTPKAIAVLDALVNRSAKDPDLLYSLSGTYTRLGRDDRAEQILAQIVQLDPSLAGASNDLGYTWAEQGKNLSQAETLVGKALQAEPDNLSFLDSMGWVLYKRGKYSQALQKLTRAAMLADPVVLDHLGDTLYRLGEQTKAALQWKQATQKIADLHEDDRDDLKQLREQLLRKQHQLEGGKPVGVAPVVPAE